MDSLKQSAVHTFALQIARELRQQFTAKLSGVTDQDLEDLAHAAINRSKEYGVVERSDIKRYAELMVEFGSDFDALPWARPILISTRSGTEKMDHLDAYTTFELRS